MATLLAMLLSCLLALHNLTTFLVMTFGSVPDYTITVLVLLLPIHDYSGDLVLGIFLQHSPCHLAEFNGKDQESLRLCTPSIN